MEMPVRAVMTTPKQVSHSYVVVASGLVKELCGKAIRGVKSFKAYKRKETLEELRKVASIPSKMRSILYFMGFVQALPELPSDDILWSEAANHDWLPEPRNYYWAAVRAELAVETAEKLLVAAGMANEVHVSADDLERLSTYAAWDKTALLKPYRMPETASY